MVTSCAWATTDFPQVPSDSTQPQAWASDFLPAVRGLPVDGEAWEVVAPHVVHTGTQQEVQGT